ncbi:MAG: chemotaxis response regulator protein-glutamate methylesterase [Methylococcales bacterium]|nr:chemotaxis response regulator protein-glutamate methylesterase [Methylococcales bacterium]
MSKIKVLIVDDSALIRQLLREIINTSPELEVVGTASDPYMARDKIKKLNPDVLTLDVEMPKMDGLTFLRNLMRLRPMPVIMISTLTEQGAEISLQALALGAVDVVAKPKVDAAQQLDHYAEAIIGKIIAASQARVDSVNHAASPQIATPTAGGYQRKLIAIGASTGGTEAIKSVLGRLPETMPPIVITQHLPVAFSHSFVRHIDQISALQACVAEHNQPILANTVYVAPGDRHLRVVASASGLCCQLNDDELVNRHKPSVEVLFDSVAEQVGDQAVGVMLTGMGNDGAKAMRTMRDQGAINIVQDENSSVVWGMPGEAYRYGAADFVLPLDHIAYQIVRAAQTGRRG